MQIVFLVPHDEFAAATVYIMYEKKIPDCGSEMVAGLAIFRTALVQVQVRVVEFTDQE